MKLCRAHSSRTGKPCKSPPIRGAAVCRVHGGSIKRVKKAAAERLAEMVDPLLSELFRIARYGESDAVRLQAVRDALDRAGYKATEKIESTGEQVFRLEYAKRPSLPTNGTVSWPP